MTIGSTYIHSPFYSLIPKLTSERLCKKILVLTSLILLYSNLAATLSLLHFCKRITLAVSASSTKTSYASKLRPPFKLIQFMLNSIFQVKYWKKDISVLCHFFTDGNNRNKLPKTSTLLMAANLVNKLDDAMIPWRDYMTVTSNYSRMVEKNELQDCELEQMKILEGV